MFTVHHSVLFIILSCLTICIAHHYVFFNSFALFIILCCSSFCFVHHSELLIIMCIILYCSLFCVVHHFILLIVPHCPYPVLFFVLSHSSFFLHLFCRRGHWKLRTGRITLRAEPMRAMSQKRCEGSNWKCAGLTWVSVYVCVRFCALLLHTVEFSFLFRIFAIV